MRCHQIPSFSYLFHLPAELRLKIYSLAIFPNTFVTPKTLVLYHSHHGFLNIHVDPTLLHTNKRIYNEALPLIYDNIVFQFDLTAPSTIAPSLQAMPDDIRMRPRAVKQSLTRKDVIKNAIPELGANSAAKYGKVVRVYDLSRLQDIEIIVSTMAIWRHDWKEAKMAAFSRVGDFFCEVLNALSVDFGDSAELGVLARKRKLRLLIEPGWGNSHLFLCSWCDERKVFRFQPEGALEVAVGEMEALVDGVKRVREVELVERGFFEISTKQEHEEPKKIRWENMDGSWKKVVEDDGEEPKY